MCPPSHDSDCLSENFGSLPIARVAQPERPQKRGGTPYESGVDGPHFTGFRRTFRSPAAAVLVTWLALRTQFRL